MTAQEAIEAIKIKEIEISGNALRIAEFFQGIGVATQALEKQTPKKPTEYMADSYCCPVCKAIRHPSASYCEHCGQALDWSDTE